MKKRMMLIGLAMLALALSSVACDSGDGLVDNMIDANGTLGEAENTLVELGDSVENWKPSEAESPNVYAVGNEALEGLIDEAGEAADLFIENGDVMANDAALTICLAGCDAMYGPLAPVFSDTEVMAACEAGCYSR